MIQDVKLNTGTYTYAINKCAFLFGNAATKRSFVGHVPPEVFALLHCIVCRNSETT